ncbi:tRNA(adenine34) deaminase [Bifidobacterium bohemicum]|uniref:tRNA-specific adenosine deaminase n=2 Tax=Bifidobacterium bohemicum TaxID=638617 RepID=A0A086ZEN3_9BIFI|nr:cytidine/deoxycytidylate deaminase family protein [Bifidobacterium bohemicum DSM 22767]SCC12628.1 tRNA(adenine34) deaminase [Bifidobacterium bohemicum]
MGFMGGAQWSFAMDEALALAREAGAAGEVPVGAVVLDAAGKVVGRGRNRREALGDPLAHAEIEAMREAASGRPGVGGRCCADAVRQGDDLTGRCPDGISAVAARRGAWNLEDCTLLVTLEPCPMCAGAALEAHVGRIVFGAWDAKLGACGSVWDIPRDPHVGARPEVAGGVRESDCARLLADFFAVRR